MERIKFYHIPFVKKFKTDKKYYLYDVNSNCFLEVEEVIYELIDFYGKCSLNSIFESLKTKFSISKIKEGLESIELSKKQGLFCSFPDYIAKMPLTIKELKLKFTKSLQGIVLNITEDCNMLCKYCIYNGGFINKRTRSRNKMTLDIAKKALDYYFQHNWDRNINPISFYGGEPLLEFEMLKKCAEYVKSRWKGRNILWNLTTNGTLLTEEIADFLISNNFTILVSLDGPPEIHDENRVYCNGRGTFSDIENNLKRIQGKYGEFYRKNITFNFVINPPFEFDKIRNFILTSELLYSHRESCLLSIVEKPVRFEPNTQELLKHKLNVEFQSFLKDILTQENYYYQNPIWNSFFLENLRMIHTRSIETIKRPFFPGINCIPGATNLNVHSNGDYSICILAETIKIGNIHAGIHFDKVIRLFRQLYKIRSKDCKQCWALRFCSICPAIIEDNGDFSDEKLKIFCSKFRQKFEKMISAYLKIRESNIKNFQFLEKREPMISRFYEAFK